MSNQDKLCVNCLTKMEQLPELNNAYACPKCKRIESVNGIVQNKGDRHSESNKGTGNY